MAPNIRERFPPLQKPQGDTEASVPGVALFTFEEIFCWQNHAEVGVTIN